MWKIFYDPVTLQIKGFSDGENSMQYPYVTAEGQLYSTDNLLIEIVDGVPTLKYKKGYYTPEEWDRLVNG